MLLHAQHVMPPYGYICDVKVVQTFIYKEILSIYWMTLVYYNVYIVCHRGPLS